MIEEIKIDRLEELIQEMMNKIRSTYPTATVKGNPVEFDNGGDAPLLKCVMKIQGYQSGSGTPSAENIRPIIAYSVGEVDVSGKNKIDESSIVGGYFLNDSGVVTANVDGAYYEQYVPVTSESYTISFTKRVDNKNFYVRIHGYNSNMEWVSLVYKTPEAIIEGGFHSFTFTIPSGISFIRFSFGIGLSNVQIEKGSTATTFESYVGGSYKTTFTSPIYKGTEDVMTGKVTAEWGYIASYNGETLPGLWISDRDEYAAGTTPTTGAQVAYELESPTTIAETVSNAPVSSVHGYNTIQSNTGEMELTYITEEFEDFALRS